MPQLSDESKSKSPKVEKKEKKGKSKGLIPVRRASKSVTNIFETREDTKLLRKNTNNAPSLRKNKSCKIDEESDGSFSSEEQCDD